jgi:hypothetical protein
MQWNELDAEKENRQDNRAELYWKINGNDVIWVVSGVEKGLRHYVKVADGSTRVINCSENGCIYCRQTNEKVKKVFVFVVLVKTQDNKYNLKLCSAPTSVKDQLATVLQAYNLTQEPWKIAFKIQKTGEGKNTRYTVLPMLNVSCEVDMQQVINVVPEFLKTAVKVNDLKDLVRPHTQEEIQKILNGEQINYNSFFMQQPVQQPAQQQNVGQQADSKFFKIT